MAKHAPSDMGPGFDVVFDDPVEEGGLAGVGDAVDEAVSTGLENGVEGGEFGGMEFRFCENSMSF